MKILITGGAGFIGSAVIRILLQDTQFKVINVDKLTYAGNLDSIPDAKKSSNYIYENTDICNRKDLERIFKKHEPSHVMHLAAESHVDRSIDGPSKFIETNTEMYPTFVQFHYQSMILLIVVFLIHLGAAIYHRFLNNDEYGIWKRMSFKINK